MAKTFIGTMPLAGMYYQVCYPGVSGSGGHVIHAVVLIKIVAQAVPVSSP